MGKRSIIFTFSAVAFAALVPLACTQDFGAFEPIDGASNNGGSGGAGSGGGSGGASSAETSSGTGDPVRCTGVNMCGDENPCTTDGCDLTAGTCYHRNVDGSVPEIDDSNPCTDEICSAGTLTRTDSPFGKSCGSNPSSKLFCDGEGLCVGCTNPLQCPAGSECQTRTCEALQCGFEDVERGTSCGSNDNQCDGDGACVECLENGDCKGGNVFCVNGACIASTCGNGMKDSLETDVDCGGAQCSPCQPGGACNENRDCANSQCTNNFCGGFPPSCLNGMKDAGETDIDCGGLVCKKCAAGKACITGADCVNNQCIGGLCS